MQNPTNKFYTDVVYKTGDLAKQDHEGNYIYIGRIDQQVKIKGNRVEFGDIEIHVAELKVIDVTLKDKTFGWHKPKSRYTFEDGSNLLIEDGNKDYFTIATIHDVVCIRRSCFNCKYKTTKRVSDISIGDFWGVNDLEMDNDEGTNVVIVNKDTGSVVFQELIDRNRVRAKQAQLDGVVSGNPRVFHNNLIADDAKRSFFLGEILENNSFSKSVISMQEEMA